LGKGEGGWGREIAGEGGEETLWMVWIVVNGYFFLEIADPDGWW
jgi:hypothetical protein